MAEVTLVLDRAWINKVTCFHVNFSVCLVLYFFPIYINFDILFSSFPVCGSRTVKDVTGENQMFLGLTR